MADNETPKNGAVYVSDAGAPEGSVYVHDTATGTTVTAPATEAGYCQAIKDLNNR
jgi:DNA-binding beta-propeller fold protein YncE